MNMESLKLESFSVAFANRTVLNELFLTLPATGMTVLVGPSGGGKSTLLRTLAGANDGHASMRVTGRITVAGVEHPDLASIPADQRPGLVRQNVRFLIDTVRENLVTALPNRASLRRPEQDDIITGHLERLGLDELRSHLTTSVSDLPIVAQRLLALARITLADPAILLVDEATASLADADANLVLTHLRRQAEERAVLFVTHHKGHARLVGGATCLLNGGRIVTAAPTHEFFEAPTHVAARQFVETGGCVPEPTEEAKQEVALDASIGQDVGVEPSASAESVAAPAGRGPRHFYWGVNGVLGGLPRPGIFQDVGDDLDALQRVKVTTLVTLEEWESVPRQEVEKRGMELVHFPINDMKAPDVDEAQRFCAETEARLRERGVVALHCRAGNGRTGTMLAAMLIHRNVSACEALERIRSVNPKAVESDVQVRFLEAFERHVRAVAVAQPGAPANAASVVSNVGGANGSGPQR